MTTPNTDDFSGDTATNGSLDPGGEVIGTLETAGDADWQAINVQAGKRYLYTLDGVPNMEKLLMQLYNADGRLLYSASPSGANTNMLVLPLSDLDAGRYYVGVESYTGVAGGYTGSYRLRAAEAAPDDYGYGADAGLLSDGQTVPGALEYPGDSDSFTATLSGGMTYLLELLDGGDPASFVNQWPLYSMLGASSLSGDDPEGTVTGWPGSKLVLRPGASSEYQFTVSANGSYAIGGYAVRLTGYASDDHGDRLAAATLLQLGAKQEASFELYGDQDWYAIVLAAGQSYDIGFQTGAGGHTAGGSTAVWLYGPAGQQLLYNGWGDDTHLSYKPSADGTYYIKADSFSNTTGSYALTVSKVVDRTAPALQQFSMDRELGLATVDAVFTARYSEDIARGFGAINLRDAGGALVARYDSTSTNVLIAGDTLTVMPQQALKYGTAYILELATGTVKDSSGNLSASRFEKFTTMAGNRVVAGTDGNDKFAGQNHSDTFNGGAGIDTVSYPGALGDYRIARAGAGFSVESVAHPMTDDLLNGVERLQFGDTAVALDVDGTGMGGAVYRLYQAAFDRTPDAAGLGFWLAMMERGLPLKAVAAEFLASGEFTKLYAGAGTDSAFIDVLYANVLHRAPDAGGRAYWLQAMQHGEDRDALLLSFSESPENVAAAATVIGSGFSYTPYH
ncbi:DUF4214 domain-containing protein [Pseudoduganella sp. LjRoot289]|uniref:DUF4214 domain-containing protein n=1 Tax=Pseudoduganella sp. LjRoot289 TaxID=3342314 RepID=UPI003ECCFC38